MPTHDETEPWQRDWRSLTPAQKAQFKVALGHFLADLSSRRFRPGLRIKRVRGGRGIYELTWADDGRATFEYGEEVRPGEAHIIWRRIGTHDIFESP